MKNVVLGGVGAAAALVLFLPVVLHQGEGRMPRPELFEDKPPSMLFVGDIMLDRDVARHARRVGAQKLFENVQPVFTSHDIVVGNLEGTITDNPSVSEDDNTILQFTFEPIGAEGLPGAALKS